MPDPFGPGRHVRVEITDSRTGVTVEHTPAPWQYDLGGLEFYWAEGNNACDCQRAAYHAEARGEEDPDLDCASEFFKVKVYAQGDLFYED